MKEDQLLKIWEEWNPQLLLCDETIEPCITCRRQQSRPFGDRCEGCQKAQEVIQDECIRNRAVHGYKEQCIGCSKPDADLWIVGFDRYSVERKGDHFYKIGLGSGYLPFCMRCAERALSTPIANQRVVHWMRNMRFVRKLKDGTHPE